MAHKSPYVEVLKREDKKVKKIKGEKKDKILQTAEVAFAGQSPLSLKIKVKKKKAKATLTEKGPWARPEVSHEKEKEKDK